MIYQRQLYTTLLSHLDHDKILLVTGPRQVGKTTLLGQIKDFLHHKDEQVFACSLEDSDILAQLNRHPEQLFSLKEFDLTRRLFVVIDEIQYLNDPTKVLKYLYDTYKGKIKIIATGSSSFYIDKRFHDSLVGRQFVFDLYPLSWKEFLHFKGRDDLGVVLGTKSFTDMPILYQREMLMLYDQFITYGGYPEVVLAKTSEEKVYLLQQYLRMIVKKDVLESGIQYEEKYLYLLKLLASQIGSLVNMNELSNILGISAPTVQQYLYVMQKSYHIALVRPFVRNIRKEIVKMPKVYMIDSGLRNSLLNNFDTIETRVDKGHLCEQAAYSSLLISYHAEQIRYRRTKQDAEVDFVVDEKKAYEVKINSKLFIPSKYNSFVTDYPSIPLQCLTYIDMVAGKVL